MPQVAVERPGGKRGVSKKVEVTVDREATVADVPAGSDVPVDRPNVYVYNNDVYERATITELSDEHVDIVNNQPILYENSFLDDDNISVMTKEALACQSVSSVDTTAYLRLPQEQHVYDTGLFNYIRETLECDGPVPTPGTVSGSPPIEPDQYLRVPQEQHVNDKTFFAYIQQTLTEDNLPPHPDMASVLRDIDNSYTPLPRAEITTMINNPINREGVERWIAMEPEPPVSHVVSSDSSYDASAMIESVYQPIPMSTPRSRRVKTCSSRPLPPGSKVRVPYVYPSIEGFAIQNAMHVVEDSVTNVAMANDVLFCIRVVGCSLN